MYCNKCNSFNPDGSEYCSYCGRQLESGNYNEVEKTQMKKQPEKRNKKNNKSIKRMIIGVSLLFVLFAGIVIGKELIGKNEDANFERIVNGYNDIIKANSIERHNEINIQLLDYEGDNENTEEIVNNLLNNLVIKGVSKNDIKQKHRNR
ncbi:MAG: hypothetical protein ACLFMO_02355 [Eubacteriales bacterium]